MRNNYAKTIEYEDLKVIDVKSKHLIMVLQNLKLLTIS